MYTEEDMKMFDQIPDDVQERLYGFLFNDFLKKFTIFFRFQKIQDKSEQNLASFKDKSYYNWKDLPYQFFMIQMLQLLEPRHEVKGQTIIEELNEVNEIIFMTKGKIGVGYEINKSKRLVLQYTD